MPSLELQFFSLSFHRHISLNSSIAVKDLELLTSCSYSEDRHQQAQERHCQSRRATGAHDGVVALSHVANFINCNKLNNLRAAGGVVARLDKGSTQRGV